MDKCKYFFYSNLGLVCFTEQEGYFEEINENFIKVFEYTVDDLFDKKIFELICDINFTIKEMEKLVLDSDRLNFIASYKTKWNPYKYLEWDTQVNLEAKKIHTISRDVTEKMIANKESFFQSEEKGKWPEELAVANKEQVFQNEEKEKRAAELIIANRELIFQNEEKEKRAAELLIANKELVFQNKEKEKRAVELIIANQELLFQNNEKEKRAAELLIANQELAFQSEEKRKRAAELIVTNKELKAAEESIRKLNEELEQKVKDRTSQLEAANKELWAFSYSISHDLRAPIRAIHGNARILEEDCAGKLNADETNALHSILHNSKKMGELIDDLLAFFRLGRRHVRNKELNMNDLLKSVIEELVAEDIRKRTEFKISPLPSANGDPSLVRQIWINLISNAIKYSRNKATIEVEVGAYNKDNYVVYFVKDNGLGFDMRYYNKLFGVFQRLHSEKEFEGTGMGLAIVQKIVQRYHGAVWAESKLNEGTCFYFSLPAAKGVLRTEMDVVCNN